MVLSERLKTVSMLVTEGNRLADIGTDHAFVPIFLVEKGRIPGAVAMDVREGPLMRARENIRQHGLEDRIETRLSDGLEALGVGEADTVLIAGMGGALTVRILERRKKLRYEVKELVLQPQSETGTVRRFLESAGFRIVQEKMVLEDGKYYPMMRCLPGDMALSDMEARYGPRLMQERPRDWLRFLVWRKGILERNLSCMEGAEGARGRRRRAELLQELEEIDSLEPAVQSPGDVSRESFLFLKKE